MEKSSVTIYLCGVFGTQRKLASQYEIKPGVRTGGNPEGLPTVSYVEKGKRKPSAQRDRSLVILAGHHHPEPASAFEPAEARAGGLQGEVTRHGSFDPAWRAEHDAMMAALIQGGAQVVLDCRAPATATATAPAEVST